MNKDKIDKGQERKNILLKDRREETNGRGQDKNIDREVIGRKKEIDLRKEKGIDLSKKKGE